MQKNILMLLSSLLIQTFSTQRFDNCSKGDLEKLYWFKDHAIKRQESFKTNYNTYFVHPFVQSGLLAPFPAPVLSVAIVIHVGAEFASTEVYSKSLAEFAN